MSKLSTIALCAAAVLQSHAALASTWCVTSDERFFAGARIELSQDAMKISFRDGTSTECASQGGGDFLCSPAIKTLCETDECDLWVGIQFTSGFPKSVGDIDLEHADLTSADLWVQPEFADLASSLVFRLCPSTNDTPMS